MHEVDNSLPPLMYLLKLTQRKIMSDDWPSIHPGTGEKHYNNNIDNGYCYDSSIYMYNYNYIDRGNSVNHTKNTV